MIRGTRGFTLLLVLIVMIALSALAVGAAILLRPTTLSLDLHEELARAQLAADAALQESLARLDAGESAAFARTQPGGERTSAEKILDGASREILVVSRFRVSAPDGRERWAVARLKATVARSGTASGHWRLTQYRIEKAGFE